MSNIKQERRVNHTKVALLIVLISVVMCVLGYGVGRLQSMANVSTLEKQVEQDKAAHRSKLESLRSDLVEQHKREHSTLKQEVETLRSKVEESSYRNAALEGRRELGRVLFSLDDRNFGIAQQFLEKSIRNLNKAGLQEEEAKAVINDLGKMKVVVAENLQKQRRTLRTYIDRLDVCLD